ncbi:amidase family protein [Oceanibium sediminis]|uniref:amidase family protein n=1 Tax=Oceanibium sediminis TaxID=2026339 RepID=UPI0018E51987|nr:amidase family protein [Oceanibium sediminis]
MNIDELSQLSLSGLQSALAMKQLSPVEVLKTTFEQIEKVNGSINALYDLRKQAAFAEAEAAERRYASGAPLSAFDGIPVSIKDSVNAVGMRWHHGTAIHREGIVASTDSPPAARLKRSGAIIIGKGAMPDFGLSGSGVSGSHGIVRNPWGLSWNTGGSSAGAGASLASGIGMMSVGSDIAGSVRLPAAHCGLAALKPTQGAIPHAPASTVRSAGPITRRAADLRAWTALLGGIDTADRYSVPLTDVVGGDAPRIGASADFGFGPMVEPAVLTCFDRVRRVLGQICGTVEDVTTKADFDAYLPIDDSLKLKGWLEYQSADPDLRDRTPEPLLAWFREVQDWTPNKIAEINQGIERGVAFTVALLAEVDILLTPVMPVVNFPAEDRGPDPKMPLRHTTFTSLFNQSGNPAVTICGGFDDRGLPIGMQLVGRRFDDYRLLDLATRLEAALDIFGAGKQRWPTVPIA